MCIQEDDVTRERIRMCNYPRVSSAKHQTNLDLPTHQLIDKLLGCRQIIAGDIGGSLIRNSHRPILLSCYRFWQVRYPQQGILQNRESSPLIGAFHLFVFGQVTTDLFFKCITTQLQLGHWRYFTPFYTSKCYFHVVFTQVRISLFQSVIVWFILLNEIRH